MADTHTDRRTPSSVAGVTVRDRTDIVTEALIIQHWSGTVGAIEFLRAYRIDGAVIRRVMYGAAVRQIDRKTLGKLFSPRRGNGATGD